MTREPNHSPVTTELPLPVGDTLPETVPHERGQDCQTLHLPPVNPVDATVWQGTPALRRRQAAIDLLPPATTEGEG